MGMIYPRTILVSASFGNRELLAQAHVEAAAQFPNVSPIMPTLINGGGTFMIPPDGSNIGRALAEEYEQKRDTFRAYLTGLVWLAWVEVEFGGDVETPSIVEGWPDPMQEEGEAE